MNLFPVIFKLISGWAVRRVLLDRLRSPQALENGRFTHTQVKQLLRNAWQIYDDLKPGLPRETTLGSLLSVRLANLTVAAYRALLAENISPEYAIMLVSDINWFLYRKGMRIPKMIAALLSRSKNRQMQIITRIIMEIFPFTPPGFQSAMKSVPLGAAFDIIRCQVADRMFKVLPAVEARPLCVASWCKQDFAAAEMWGGLLVRRGTLAGGQNRCDFHYLAQGEENP